MRVIACPVVSLLLAMAAGCGDSSPPAGDSSVDATADAAVDSAADTSPPLPDGSPEDCFSLTYSTADPVEMSSMLGETMGDSFVRYADTGHASFEWGFQGGTMITPRIALPADVASEGDCVNISLENLQDPAFPGGAEGLQDYFPVEGIDTYRIRATGYTDALFDQIAWDDPTGWHFLLKATVRGEDFAFTETVALEIDPPTDVPPQCLALPPMGRGCSYRHVPGEAMITGIETSTSTTCTDPRRVMGIFTPTDPTHAVCYEGYASEIAEAQPLLVNFDDPPSACLTGYDVGDPIPAVLEVIVAGGCVPWQLRLDLSACVDMCM